MAIVATGLLPVHGFVLAGGRSSRMGKDKALVQFRGRPMVEIALQTLAEVCAEVSLSCNDDAMQGLAEVVKDKQPGQGPAGGLEAALTVARWDWVLMMPVDLPMMSAELIRGWAEFVLGRQAQGVRASYLRCGGDVHPALCMLHRDCQGLIAGALAREDRKLTRIFAGLEDALMVVDAETLTDEPQPGRYFMNVNNEADLADAEAAAVSGRWHTVAGENANG